MYIKMCTCDTGVDEDDGFEQLASLVGMVCQVFHLYSHLGGYRDSLLCNQHWTEWLGDQLHVTDSSHGVPGHLLTGNYHVLLRSQHFLFSWFVTVS